jgi:dolichol-phosphate mannosyltransferase
MKLSVVIAAYDERENVEPLLGRLLPVLREMTSCDWEIVFVVEGTDGTREVLEGLQGTTPQVRVLYDERPSGLGAAFRRGFASLAPDRDVVVTMDADLNHQPEEIPRLVETLMKERADIVVGSRFVPGGRIEGTPFWKRVLSRTMNETMKGLFGLSVHDKTSGFRVYRGEALRALSFRNDDFAFLPELLVSANRAGMTIVEQPIRFVYRTVGHSKMAITKTIKSYLKLLIGRFDLITWIEIGVFLIGAVVRTVAAFPLHKFPADADALLTGMRALDILEGRFHVFYSSVRIGALESYLHAPWVLLLGPTRLALSIVPVLENTLTIFFFWLLAREVLSRRAACLALVLFAVPTPNYIFWTYMPNGYATIMLLGVAVLALAARWDRHPTGQLAAGLGVAAGFGVWCSLQTLSCLAGSVLWLLLGGRLRRGRLVLGATLGFVIGALPWLTYNVVYPLGAFRGNYGTRPASGLSAVVSNASYAVRGSLADLLASTEPQTAPSSSIHVALRKPALVLYVLATVFVVTVLWASRRGGEGKVSIRAWTLPALAAIFSLALFSVSAAGQFRGMTSRYLFFCYPFLVLAIAFLISRISQQLPAAGFVLAGGLLVFHVSGYFLPWSELRRTWQGMAGEDSRLLDTLRQNNVDAILGDYWSVYPVNYLSGGRMRAISAEPWADYYNYGDRLPEVGVRWALVSAVPDLVEKWVHRAKLPGRLGRDGRYTYFVPVVNPAPVCSHDFILRMQTSFNSPEPRLR